MYFQMYFPCLKIGTIYLQQFGKLILQFILAALKKEECILIESFLLNSFLWVDILWISIFFQALIFTEPKAKSFISFNLITSSYEIETKISYFFQC